MGSGGAMRAMWMRPRLLHTHGYMDALKKKRNEGEGKWLCAARIAKPSTSAAPVWSGLRKRSGLLSLAGMQGNATMARFFRDDGKPDNGVPLAARILLAECGDQAWNSQWHCRDSRIRSIAVYLACTAVGNETNVANTSTTLEPN